MRSLFKQSWQSLAALGLLAAATGWVMSAPRAGCTVPPPENERSMKPATNPMTSRNGEKTMLPFTKATTENKVQHVDTSNFEELVLKSDVRVMVDFYADWCGPCRMVAPILEEIAGEVPGARIAKVNVDESPELAMRYGISSIPSLKVFQDGQVVAEQLGVASKSRLKALLEE
jgi:thioredoxin 1